jgi:hypothetical protein
MPVIAFQELSLDCLVPARVDARCALQLGVESRKRTCEPASAQQIQTAD